MRLKGTLVDWNDARGFGFIQQAGGGERTFCHVSAFTTRARRPVQGDRVTYEISRDGRGRLRAARVLPVSVKLRKEEHQAKRPQASPLVAYVCVSLFLVAVIILAVIGRVPLFVPLIYLCVSGFTIFAYALDKSAAINRLWRTQEQTLHVLELLGGWPGAWIAQRLFHHKSRKTEFIVTFWACVVINVAALLWLSGLLDFPLKLILQN